MTPNQNPRDRTDVGKLAARFLGGMVAAGLVSIAGMLVGAACSAVAGTDALPLFMTFGTAAFAALGARFAWRGVAGDFGISLGLWVLGTIVAFVASLLGLAIGYNVISSLPWVVLFAAIGANVVHAIAWFQPDLSSSE